MLSEQETKSQDYPFYDERYNVGVGINVIENSGNKDHLAIYFNDKDLSLISYYKIIKNNFFDKGKAILNNGYFKFKLRENEQTIVINGYDDLINKIDVIERKK
ncbi:hypothetical protein D3C73_1362860 [compost metagenome]